MQNLQAIRNSQFSKIEIKTFNTKCKTVHTRVLNGSKYHCFIVHGLILPGINTRTSGTGEEYMTMESTRRSLKCEFLNSQPQWCKNWYIDMAEKMYMYRAVLNRFYISLGVMERNDPYNLTEKSCSKVIIFEMDGKQKQSYGYDKHNLRIFTVPFRITTNVNNDMVVINKIPKKDGRVVVLNREGQVKWTYQGHPQVYSEAQQFNPLDIVTTSVGHVIVVDFQSHALHVLSGEGDILTYKVMEDQGILFPLSLDSDTNGQLWVGCHSGDDQRKDAKLHIMKMSF